jgi:crotonobetainyl-CoA:carnitine CoA-transferase CaiB-like acyl-CoA transferase
MMPLEGIRVLDLARQGPGPFCSMVLSDLGAEVLLIEPPPGAVGSRARGEQDEEALEHARAHQALRRNKRSIVLNLREDEAREVVYRLARDADVVMEGFRPGVVRRLGVDYETLCGHNPRIVYCSLSGYGQDGPYAQLVGHDVNYISITGALSMIGRPGQKPAIPQNILADFAAGGQAAVIAILAALLARQTTGRGQYLDLAMSDSVLYVLASAVSGVLGGGTVPLAGEGMLAGGVPFIDVYETKDGRWVSVASLEPHFWQALCEALGRPDFVPLQHDASRHEEIREHFERTFKQKTRDDWFEELRPLDICFAPVLTLDEALNNEHNRARGMVVEVEDPRVGTVEQIGIGLKFSDTQPRVRSTAPRPGEHTDEVLSGLDYDADRVAGLRQRGVVA